MALPVPSHLREIAIPLGEPVSADELRAEIRCPCTERRFELHYAGPTVRDDGLEMPGDAFIEGRYFFLIEAHCLGCRRKHVLLDRDFHGWDGVMCHDPEQAAAARPPLIPWGCRGCAGLQHYLAVTITGESEASFLEEAGDADPALWPDAFGFFALDATCAQCGRDEPGLCEYETM